MEISPSAGRLSLLLLQSALSTRGLADGLALFFFLFDGPLSGSTVSTLLYIKHIFIVSRSYSLHDSVQLRKIREIVRFNRKKRYLADK